MDDLCVSVSVWRVWSSYSFVGCMWLSRAFCRLRPALSCCRLVWCSSESRRLRKRLNYYSTNAFQTSIVACLPGGSADSASNDHFVLHVHRGDRAPTPCIAATSHSSLKLARRRTHNGRRTALHTGCLLERSTDRSSAGPVNEKANASENTCLKGFAAALANHIAEHVCANRERINEADGQSSDSSSVASTHR